jgi:hypothetical protein
MTLAGQVVAGDGTDQGRRQGWWWLVMSPAKLAELLQLVGEMCMVHRKLCTLAAAGGAGGHLGRKPSGGQLGRGAG